MPGNIARACSELARGDARDSATREPAHPAGGAARSDRSLGHELRSQQQALPRGTVALSFASNVADAAAVVGIFVTVVGVFRVFFLFAALIVVVVAVAVAVGRVDVFRATIILTDD